MTTNKGALFHLKDKNNNHGKVLREILTPEMS